jgi:hypothetical protein
MELLLILILAGGIGYLFARSKYRKNVESAVDTVSTSSKSYTARATGWWRRRFGKKSDPFRAWATGPGASYFDNTFKTWLAGLTEDEAKAFSKSLEGYSSGLGFDLSKIEKGELDKQPALMQVFVEAVVVYSGAYRKARQAHQDVAANSGEKSEEPTVEEKKSAEKSVSRRKSDGAEAAPAA